MGCYIPFQYKTSIEKNINVCGKFQNYIFYGTSSILRDKHQFIYKRHKPHEFKLISETVIKGRKRERQRTVKRRGNSKLPTLKKVGNQHFAKIELRGWTILGVII